MPLREKNKKLSPLTNTDKHFLEDMREELRQVRLLLTEAMTVIDGVRRDNVRLMKSVDTVIEQQCEFLDAEDNKLFSVPEIVEIFAMKSGKSVGIAWVRTLFHKGHLKAFPYRGQMATTGKELKRYLGECLISYTETNGNRMKPRKATKMQRIVMGTAATGS